jgi:membrane-bound serine protease (ClpP class)
VRRLAIILAGFAALLALTASPATAQEPPEPLNQNPGTVDVLQVSGLFDQIVVAKIHSSLESAIASGSQALILQVDSRGAVVDSAEMVELFETIANSPITVGVWVGPTGARLYGTPAQILAVADVTGMAPGAEVGRMTRPLTLESGPIDFGDATSALRTSSLGLSEARELNVFKQRIPDQGIATIANMVDALDGFEKNGLILETTIETVSEDGTVQRDTVAVVRFAKLSLLDELFHTVASLRSPICCC